MAPGVLAAISAVAALAQAGGAAASAFGAGKEARAKRRQDERYHEDDLKGQAEDRKLAMMRMGIEADQVQAQKPMSALGFISGLQDFSEKRARSGNYLDTVRGLARR